MSNKKLLLFLLFANASLCVLANNGFGIWTSAELTKRIRPGFNVSLEGNFRTRNNVQNVDRWDIGASLSYRLNPYLKVGGGYKYLYKYSPSRIKVDLDEPVGTDKGYYSVESKYYSPYWQSRHRFHVDIAGNYIWRRFTFTLRERYQYTRRMEARTKRIKSDLLYSTTFDEALNGYPHIGSSITGEDERAYGGDGRNVLRSRLAAAYNIRKCAWDPYASCEFYNALNTFGRLYKIRWTVGVEYKMTKKQSFDFSYCIQQYMYESNIYALCVAYSYKF